mmetsp:Transcript_114421/g.201901  ORF Transcript_114421/g.201901 Transcript_114421/m.201901 type:complete len:621 (-) Transcript_114421:41-1903(-)
MAWTARTDRVPASKASQPVSATINLCSGAASSTASTASGASASSLDTMTSAPAHLNSQDDVAVETAQYVASFTAAARHQRLQAELASLQAHLKEVAAARLQRWYRRWYWRVHLLPQQLLRVNILLYSCLTIQRAWRSVLTRRLPLNYGVHRQRQQLEVSLQSPESSPVPQVLEVVHANDELPGGSSSCGAHGAEGRMWQHHRSVNDSVDAALGFSSEPYAGALAVDLALDVDLSTSLGPGGARAAAVWRGCRVRRALASRNLQGKIQLRHDLYLLISDVESRGQLRPNGPLPARLAPWVDVLYSGLARLQGEVLQEFNAVLDGHARMWGAARCPLIWRGWPRDLLRVPHSLPAGTGCSQSFSDEPSLLASTTYQVCSPVRIETEQLEADNFEDAAPQRWRRAGSASPTRTSSPLNAHSPTSARSVPSSPQWSSSRHGRSLHQVHAQPRVDCWATPHRQTRQLTASSASASRAVCEAIRGSLEPGSSRRHLAALSARYDESMPRPGYMSDDNDDYDEDDFRDDGSCGHSELRETRDEGTCAATASARPGMGQGSPRWNRRLDRRRRAPASKGRGHGAHDFRPSPRVRPGSLDSPEDVAAAMNYMSQQPVRQIGVESGSGCD